MKKFKIIFIVTLLISSFILHTEALKNNSSEDDEFDLTFFQGLLIPRRGHSMVYDSSNKVHIMFGGENNRGKLLDDTWVFDIWDNTWTKMNPPRKPSPRVWHSMAYDSNNDIVILFGGKTSDGYNDETWVYDYKLNNWFQMYPDNIPSPRYQHAMTYLSYDELTILYGGHTEPDGSGSNINDEFWGYSYSNDNWHEIQINGKLPVGRERTSIFNNSEAGFCIFGGHTTEGLKNDFIKIGEWSGKHCNIITTQNTPLERDGHSLNYDNREDCIVIFGGSGTNGLFDDTYELEDMSVTWERTFSSEKPSPRAYHAMSYDSELGYVVLFGGQTNDKYVGDTWRYDAMSNDWYEIDPKIKTYQKNVESLQIGQLGIHSIKGGFGVEAVIENNGDTLEDVLWRIEFEGLVLINRVTEGIIEEFPDHSSLKINTGFIFGLSPGFVRVNVWKDTDEVSESRDCIVLGPIVILR